jgi:hypothetical protein
MYAVRMKGKLCPLRYDSAIKIRQRLINQIDGGSLTTSQVLCYLYPCLLSAATRLEQEAEDEDLHYYWQNNKFELTRTSFDA